MSASGDARRSGPRLPGLLNTGLVVALVLVVAAVALTARQSPPPTVAEFAPQAVEQIEEALPEQADGPTDAGEGSVAAPEASPTPEPSEPAAVPTPEDEPVIERARVRRCVGDPPRQTEDPQSPPCVPFFEGDNGGATWQGVTADEIRVAYPNLDFFGPEPVELVQAMADHFNRRFEFYGRKIVFVEYSSVAFGEPDPPAMTADAVMVDEELQAFASLGYGARQGAEHHYYDELARRGVVSVSSGTLALGTEERYDRFAPHEWTWNGAVSTTLSLAGDFVCSTLAGKPPVGGTFQADGGPLDPGDTFRPEERVFGVVTTRSSDGTIPPVHFLNDRLAACGQGPAVSVEDDISNPQGDNVILQMQDAGVTSVLCVCSDLNVLRSNYMQAASRQGYFPEWVFPGYGTADVDNSFYAEVAPPEQARNVLGITIHDRFLPRQQMPWYWAIRESMPEADPAGGVYYSLLARYYQLLNLASGIQLAGPNLTPETFQQGLARADFPNPGAGGPPQYQAAIDFHGSHTARASAALYWYSTQDSGVVEPERLGAVCYLDGGTRYEIGEFPTEQQPWFQPPCIR